MAMTDESGKPDFPDEPCACDFPVVGIGASAGGLEALRDMLGPAAPGIGMAFVVVQHLDPNHESMMAQLLTRATTLPVTQIQGGEALAPDHVYIIPPGHGLAVERGILSLTEFRQPRGVRRPIDDFFESLARDVRNHAACVILSGTGADGATGLRAVKEHGGLCIAQEPGSARYDGMPLAAAGTGLVDYVREPQRIVQCLTQYFTRRERRQPDYDEASLVADHVDELCRTLRDAVGHDFSHYKRSTLVRRVDRRMKVIGVDSGGDYLARLKREPQECAALFRDLLINVTRFFRDPELFETLRTQAIVKLVAACAADGEIRVWVPGCSSGEEAYTIAMLLAEEADRAGKRPLTQVFATDIDEQMLAIGREGKYQGTAIADIPEPYRDKFTAAHGERMVIVPRIRDMVRFSNHSLIKDPPFSKMNLVSCRNLLIYFSDRLQQVALPVLHYALVEGGMLFLGPSESVGRFEGLFTLHDHRARLFERRPGKPAYAFDLTGDAWGERVRPLRAQAAPPRAAWEEALSTRRLVERYAPASMVLDEDGAIIASHGQLSRYFEFPSSNAPGVTAASLARPGLREILYALQRQAQTGRERRVARNVQVQSELGRQAVTVICDPLPDGTTLLVLKDAAAFEFDADEDMVEMGPVDGHVQMLEDELRITRHRLRSAVEELETANEELKSSNEEMMSMNEELQSTNEELTTVNDELKTRVDQLVVANADLRNFFESTQLAVVVLDEKLAIRNFTEAVKKVFPLQESDRRRPLADVATFLEDTSYLEDARQALEGGKPPQRRMSTRGGGSTYALSAIGYRAVDGALEGATLVFADITDAVQLQDALARERERLELALQVAKVGVWEYRADTGMTILDRGERALFGLQEDDRTDLAALLGRIHPEDRDAVDAQLQRVAAGNGEFEAVFRVIRPDGEIRCLKGLGRLAGDRLPHRLVGVTFDITAEWSLTEQRELMLREMNHRVKNLFAIIGSLISVAAKTAPDPLSLARMMRNRIEALGRAHSLSGTREFAGCMALETLVRAVIEPYRDGARVTIEGPAVTLDRGQLTPLTLVLHEWATNAVKYGALATEAGALSVSWEESGGRLRLRWREENCPPHGTDGTPGFGSYLIEMSARQLGAEMQRERTATRYEATLSFRTLPA